MIKKGATERLLRLVVALCFLSIGGLCLFLIINLFIVVWTTSQQLAFIVTLVVFIMAWYVLFGFGG